MSVVVPDSLDDALAALVERPDAHLLAGGTDFMVEVNFGERRPPAVVSVGRLEELRGWTQDGDALVCGGALTYSEMADPEFSALAPALSAAARTVGSPQIRNAGTIGGNIATASPAGDTLPVLYALDAEVDIASADGNRRVPIDELITGVKQTTLRPTEVIAAVRIPKARGNQEFLKVGTRNAMVISAAGVAVVADTDARAVTCALGSVAPTIVRATAAEEYAAASSDWGDPDVQAEFGELAAEASSPIDDHRSSARYRRHAIAVMASRALARCA